MRREKEPKKKWKVWQKITVTLAVVLLVAGLGFLLFPTVSNFFGQQRANATIDEFKESLRHVVPSDTEDDTAPTDSTVAGVTAHTFKEALE